MQAQTSTAYTSAYVFPFCILCCIFKLYEHLNIVWICNVQHNLRYTFFLFPEQSEYPCNSILKNLPPSRNIRRSLLSENQYDIESNQLPTPAIDTSWDSSHYNKLFKPPFNNISLTKSSITSHLKYRYLSEKKQKIFKESDEIHFHKTTNLIPSYTYEHISWIDPSM